jgi:dTDP-4-amino-4,6-dideoxygalactose transaminase
VETVPFLDIKAQIASIRSEIDEAIARVVDQAHFVHGDEVRAFEDEFAAWLGARHVVGVATGLDALRLALEALNVSAGDEVILPANTFIATALAVSATGATPVLVDCDEAGLLDPALVENVITPHTRAIMPVHLYGQAADMGRLSAIAARHGIDLVEDAAQAHGARDGERTVGTLGRIAGFSFYPGKNLGALGDGGAVATDDDHLAERVRRLGNYGQVRKYVHVEKGANSRLDTLQAAVLRVKLRHLDAWNQSRMRIAALYDRGLAGTEAQPLPRRPGAGHVHHLYVVRHPRRDALQKHLADLGIGTLVHYPRPVHLHEAYAELAPLAGSFPVAEKLSREVLSLPMYAELRDDQVDRVVEAVRASRN